MATTDKPLLDYVKGVLAAMTPASPAASTSRVYTMPDDYGSVTATVPFVVVSRQQDEITVQQNRALYNVDIYVYLHKGELAYPSADYAAMELKARQWLSAIVDWQRGKKPFSTHGQARADYTADVTMLQWNQEPYNGLYVSIPVLQHLGV